MKSLRGKFEQNVKFVKPLYKKIRIDSRVKPIKKVFVAVDVNNDTKLCGDEIYVKRKIVKGNGDSNVIDIIERDIDKTLPGVCVYKHCKNKRNNNFDLKTRNKYDNVKRRGERNVIMGEENVHSTKSIQAEHYPVSGNKTRDTWLRVFPAVHIPGESILSVILRCLVCQLGLATFLILWTILWIFVINYFEGPFETEVSSQFEKAQNQLVIDLATELRQITPVSPKWKYAIEQRIEDERELTLRAVARGAKLHPGEFWNLSGTFLFTVYVMTALVVNFSTCVVANTEANLIKFKNCLRYNKHNINGTPDDNCNSEIIKSRNRRVLRRRIICLFNVLSIGRCVPLVTLTYYAVGAICFGVLRGKKPLEIVMFPLEFTTTGGLEHVQSYVRVLYGFYVQGAMTLLACTLATLRRHNSAAMTVMSEKYRLFSKEN